MHVTMVVECPSQLSYSEMKGVLGSTWSGAHALVRIPKLDSRTSHHIKPLHTDLSSSSRH